MNTTNFDYRWLAIIFIILLLVFPRSPQLNIVVLGIGAGWAIQAGLAPWRGSRGVLGGTKVSYWRGQRIVTKQPARARIRSASSVQLLVSLIYLVLGLGMAYAALARFLFLVTFP